MATMIFFFFKLRCLGPLRSVAIEIYVQIAEDIYVQQ